MSSPLLLFLLATEKISVCCAYKGKKAPYKYLHLKVSIFYSHHFPLAHYSSKLTSHIDAKIIFETYLTLLIPFSFRHLSWLTSNGDKQSLICSIMPQLTHTWPELWAPAPQSLLACLLNTFEIHKKKVGFKSYFSWSSSSSPCAQHYLL